MQRGFVEIRGLLGLVAERLRRLMCHWMAASIGSVQSLVNW